MSAALESKNLVPVLSMTLARTAQPFGRVPAWLQAARVRAISWLARPGIGAQVSRPPLHSPFLQDRKVAGKRFQCAPLVVTVGRLRPVGLRQ